MWFSWKKGITNVRIMMRQHQFINKYLEAAVNRYAQFAGTCDTKFSQ